MFNLAFSCSGVRFAAHIGVLAYLQDHNIKIRNYSGTSGGALVAAWGANGLPARDLMNLTLQFGYPKFFAKPSFALGGFLDHSIFGKIVSSYCKPKKNLWITTFNLLKLKKEIWTGEGFNLSKILTATTCIPGLFKPVFYSNGIHIDGLFADFCPDGLWENGNTISVQLKSENKTKPRYPLNNLIHSIEKITINCLQSIQDKNKKKKNMTYINPDVSSIAQLDLFIVNANDHIQLFEKGYQSAKDVFEKTLKNQTPAC